MTNNGIEQPTRKPRETHDFGGKLRALAESHRARLKRLVAAEEKAEAKLATLRAQREAAEGPLREVEEILARRPELPLQPEPVAITAGGVS